MSRQTGTSNCLRLPVYLYSAYPQAELNFWPRQMLPKRFAPSSEMITRLRKQPRGNP